MSDRHANSQNATQANFCKTSYFDAIFERSIFFNSQQTRYFDATTSSTHSILDIIIQINPRNALSFNARQ